MSGQPVSIVIPCYNRADMLGPAIESALAQAGCDIVVVDDGSTDDSAEVAARYDSVRLIRVPNGGVGNARNIGLAEARGEFVSFLDADDRKPAGAVTAMLREARELGPTQVLFGRGRPVAEDGRAVTEPIYGYPAVPAGSELSLADLLGGIMSPVLPLFPREALKRLGGFDPSLALGEDHHLAVRLHAAGYRFVASDVLACLITQHSGARLSRLPSVDQSRRTVAQWRAVAAAAAPMLASDRSAGKALAQRIWVDARQAVRVGTCEDARTLFDMARELSPHAAGNAPWLLRSLYGLVDPVSAERGLERAKRLRRRPSAA